MIDRLFRFLGLVDAPIDVLPPQIGAAIDKDALKALRGGVVAVVDRPNGKTRLAIRSVQNGVSGLVLESGHFYPDTNLIFDSYGLPDGWQAYEVAPFEPFEPTWKGEAGNGQ